MRKREITERTKIHKGSEHTIQAAILQVMGSRKTLSYQTLIQEVNSELSQRFTPTHIAKVVEDMLVKKQIEHAEGQPDVSVISSVPSTQILTVFYRPSFAARMAFWNCKMRSYTTCTYRRLAV